MVSKCVKGEYWKMVKKGMEDAVKEINKAYGYKKDDQITMTFEGPDNEEDVETQINTVDAVIAEFRMFFVFRQVTWIPVRHSLKLQRKMEFRL